MKYNNLKMLAREDKEKREKEIKNLKEMLENDESLYKNYALSYLTRKDTKHLTKEEQITKIINKATEGNNKEYVNILESLDIIWTFHRVNYIKIEKHKNSAIMIIEGSTFRAKKVAENLNVISKVLNQSIAIKKLLCDFKEYCEYIKENNSTIFRCLMKNDVIPRFSLLATDDEIIHCFTLLGFNCTTEKIGDTTYYLFERKEKLK